MFHVKMYTEEHPEGRYLAPEGQFARPYIYRDRADAETAVGDAKAGMRCAGVSTDFVTHLIEKAES